MGLSASLAALPPLPSVVERDAAVPRVPERMKDARAMCSRPQPAPPLESAAWPPCQRALDELEREIEHERYLRARALASLLCSLGEEGCEGGRRL